MSAIHQRHSRLHSLSAALIASQRETTDLLATPMLTVTEFAKSMDIHVGTARSWLNRSVVKGYRAGRGNWKIPLTELARLKGIQ